MDKKLLISKLSDYANKTWSVRKQISHGHDGIWDKYPCANPEGPVDNSDCDSDEPLCNCPCQDLKPDSDEQVARINESIEDDTGSFWNNLFGAGLGGFFGLGGIVAGWLFGGSNGISTESLKEPTHEEIEEAKENIKECDNISKHLNEEWLGCMWHNDNHPSSCNCPCVGSKFGEYLKYTRMQSTYWDTTQFQPLWRNAQMNLITSNVLILRIHGDLTLRPGTLIFVKDILNENSNYQSKIGGRWLIQSIIHNIGAFPVAHDMQLRLIRDTSPTDMNESSDWLGVMNYIRKLIG